MYKIVYSSLDKKMPIILADINGCEYADSLDARKALTQNISDDTKRIGLYKDINQSFAKYMLVDEFVVGPIQLVRTRTISKQY